MSAGAHRNVCQNFKQILNQINQILIQFDPNYVRILTSVWMGFPADKFVLSVYMYPVCHKAFWEDESSAVLACTCAGAGPIIGERHTRALPTYACPLFTSNHPGNIKRIKQNQGNKIMKQTESEYKSGHNCSATRGSFTPKRDKELIK